MEDPNYAIFKKEQTELLIERKEKTDKLKSLRMKVVPIDPDKKAPTTVLTKERSDSIKLLEDRLKEIEERLRIINVPIELYERENNIKPTNLQTE